MRRNDHIDLIMGFIFSGTLGSATSGKLIQPASPGLARRRRVITTGTGHHALE
jgi:hypothetical protein